VSASLVDYTLSLIPKIVASEVVHTTRSIMPSHIPPIPPMPPPGGIAGMGAGFPGFSAIAASLVIGSDAALNAFSSALRTTSAGSITSASSRLSNFSLRALKPKSSLRFSSVRRGPAHTRRTSTSLSRVMLSAATKRAAAFSSRPFFKSVETKLRRRRGRCCCTTIARRRCGLCCRLPVTPIGTTAASRRGHGLGSDRFSAISRGLRIAGRLLHAAGSSL
jgi:hypothetical protein